MLDRRNVLTFLAASAAASVVRPDLAEAATYPTRPVTLVHQYTAGGTTDIVARLVGDGLQKTWGVPVLVDSRPGGGGIVGAAYVANAAPDGYTLLLTISLMSILPAIRNKLPFNVEKSFSPIMQVATLPFLILTSKASGIRTVEQLISMARQTPNKITCGTPGIGTPHHFALEVFDKATGVSLRHVPYKGAAGVMTDLTSGTIDMAFLGYPGTSGFIEAGSVYPIAVTGAVRSPLLPNTPTVAESGYPQYVEETWYGLLGPAGMPPDVIDKIYHDVSAVLAAPESTEKMRVNGLDVAEKAPEQFTQSIHDEIALFKTVVADSKIEVN